MKPIRLCGHLSTLGNLSNSNTSNTNNIKMEYNCNTVNTINILDIFNIGDCSNDTIVSKLNAVWNSIPTTTSTGCKIPFDNSIVPVFKKIVEFINIQSSFWVRERLANTRGDTRTEVESQRLSDVYQHKTTKSFLDLLKLLNDDSGSEKDTKNCRCNKLAEPTKETLQEHLVYCMVWNLFLMRCGSYQEQITYGLLGLLHDIGKNASKVISKNVKPAITIYPYHGEISNIICYGMFTKKHAKIVPYDTWDQICQAIRVHMCGYHLMGDEDDHLMKWNYLRLETFKTKEMLVVQSIADIFARSGSTSVEFLDFLDSRTTFSNYIHAPFDPEYASKAVSASAKIDRLRNNTAIIMIRSINIQEKEKTLKKVVNSLETRGIKHVVITRDKIVEEFVKNNYPEEYKSLLNTSSTNVVPISKIYGIYAPNVQTRLVHARAVTREIRDRIKRTILQGIVVVLDDTTVMFSGAYDIFPDEVANCFKIAIDVRSNLKSYFSPKYGDIQKQLNSLNVQGWEMIPPKSNCIFSCLRSCMSAKTYKSGLVKINTAHLVLPVVFNNDYKCQGFHHFERFLDKTQPIWNIR